MRDDSDSRVSIQESTATTSSSRNRVSRRRFLEATAAATAIASVSGIAAAQDGTETETPTPTDGGGGGQVAQTFELDGETAGWQGRSPSSIEGQTNPTLQFEAGQTYEITWTNVDGASHNIAILDSNGNELESTEIMNQQGESQTLTFQATEEMAEYYCAVHPQSMRGQVNLGGGGGGTGTETPTPTDGTPTPTDGTPTPTEEGTPTPTEEDTPTPAEDGGDGGGGTGGQPGFGVIAALSGLAGAGAYLRRRMNRNEK